MLEGALMVNVTAFDVPPPGAGLNTVTLAVPAAAMSLAGIDAVNCAALTKVVARSDPFHRTAESATKFVPITVNVKAEPPAVAEDGFKLLVAGTGLDATGALMVNVTALDVPPPGAGLKTVTLAAPAVAISAAVMEAVNCVALTNVVVRLDPFHRTADPLTKLLPLIVSVKAAPPAAVEDGFRLLIAGTGLDATGALMANVTAPEVPPPGAGLKTVTLAVPAVAMSAAVIAAVN